ncbi:fibropellin-1-like [Montipora foliosa]|uniref:fibropellin-1-like n=1 Tax=Montipora foliosa TaxID=591990 RepID=UPI0035F14720
MAVALTGRSSTVVRLKENNWVPLFLVMINDLELKSPLESYWKYTDDVTVSKVREAQESSSLQADFDEISRWAERNDTKLNGKKCKEMTVSFLRHCLENQPLRINDRLLDSVSSFKVLGVTLNNQLKWNDNMVTMVKKASKRLYILRVLRRYGVPPADLRLTYFSLVRTPEYCTSAPCLNGGTCKETNSGYNCLCKSRFRGPNCEVENHCRPKNPCSNGGLCVEEDDGYKCRCKIGYTGVNCEEKEQCVPNPCKNGGTCIAEQDGYSCMCQANFRGEICQIQEMCASNPCLHKGTCIDMDNNSFKCLCAAGWMGHNCEEKDSCIPNPCNNGGNCQRHGFTFECKCALGYKGKHCEAKDPCSPNPCHNRGHCLARGENGFKCKCGHEFTGFKCEKVNPCYPDPCTNGGTCKTIAESFNCACPLGRLGEFCEVSDPCFPNPCQNDGSCSALSHGGYHCTCVHAFVGALCAVPDPCMPSPCLNNGTCVNTGTTFHCRCAPGFSGSRCEHHSKCVPNPCLHDGTCRDVDLARGYVCYCSVAYLGPNCERTNLCYPHNPCQNGGTCKSDGTNQACHCVPGYLGSQCEQFNYCHSSPCKNDGTCTPKTNGFECECKQGFFGKKCETMSSHCFPNPCKNEGLCTEVKNKDGYMCICKEGFVGDNCERNDPCAPNPCQNSGTCLEAHTKRGYHCLCTQGWRGYVCDRQDLCSPKSPCLHGGTCFNALDTFICHCPPRYTGNNCTTDKCDRCDEQANCLTGTCECKHGFVGNGFTCIPVGNPCQPNPCENGGTCNRGHGGKLFECVCKEGFTGNKCEVSKSACVSSPCVNGGTCVDATNNDGSVLEGVLFTNHSQYKCVCAKGYAGQNCQKLVLVNPCSTHPCVNNGTCFDDANSAEMNIKLLNSLDFRCFCPIGFSGIICQIPYSACKSSPCLHGGSCLDSSNTADVAFSANGYKCLCVEGFNGPNCEDVSESSSRPLAIHVLPQVTPQLPNAARTSAMAQKKEPNQLIKPEALTISPNIGATAELTKPSQSQIEVAVIPKVPERASVATNAGVPSSSGPPIVTILAPPNSIGNIPEAQDQSPSRPVGYLVPPSTVLKYVPSLNLQTASAKAVSPNIVSRIKSASSPSPSAVLIPSPAFQSSDESDTAAFPVVVQSPIIAMPPGMKPPPDENRLLNPASIKGAPRLLLPTLQENSHQRGFTHQTSNAGYYSHEPGDRNQLRQGYRKSPYSNIQGHFGYLYPENGYQTNVKAKGTLQRRYRHIEDTSHQSYSRRRSLMTSRN